MTPAPPGLRAISAGLAAGSVALLMLGLQPLLLGALAAESRLSVDQIGQAATAELLALGVTTGLLAALAPARHLRLVNVAACLGLAAANLAGLFTSGAGAVAARGAAGVAAGCMVWIAIALITRAARPDRLAGIFLTVQTLAQAGLAAILPVTLMPRFGANGGLATLAALALAAMAASFFLPEKLPPLPKPESGGAGVPLRGFVGLASVFFYMAGIVGLWVFVERLGAAAHVAEAAAGFAVAAALAAQVTGSSAATLLTGRIPAVAVLAAAGALNVGIAFTLGGAISTLEYFACITLFGFLWLFAMPFQTRLLIDLDPSRRTAMLLSAAQLLGSAAGPMVTSAFATETSLTGTLTADSALFVAATALVALLKSRLSAASPSAER